MFPVVRALGLKQAIKIISESDGWTLDFLPYIPCLDGHDEQYNGF